MGQPHDWKTACRCRDLASIGLADLGMERTTSLSLACLQRPHAVRPSRSMVCGADVFPCLNEWRAALRAAELRLEAAATLWPLVVICVALTAGASSAKVLKTQDDALAYCRSGHVLLFTALPMILSGALIQTAVSPGWRNAWITVHLISSLLWRVGCFGHLFRHRSAARR